MPGRLSHRWFAHLLLAVPLASPPAAAQIAPGPAEIAAFGALHAAAHAGDLARLRAALSTNAPVNGRDGHGRRRGRVQRSQSHHRDPILSDAAH